MVEGHGRKILYTFTMQETEEQQEGATAKMYLAKTWPQQHIFSKQALPCTIFQQFIWILNPLIDY